jgi:UDP-N-acetylglucosamine--N-acetylmuramyl-(pentapeptide) pyrophosphoryl-undecaprenol N-acetylglucosamine transferase
MGGSQGASGINVLLAGAAASLAAWQVVHLAGENDVGVVSAAYEAASLPAVVLPFCDRMQDVYPAADLAVSRSGAASLSELSFFGVPSLLIPYPYAAEDHQRLNAEIFERAGAAVIVPEKSTSSAALARTLNSLRESPGNLPAMSAAAKALAPGDAARQVARVLTEAGR